MLTVKLLNASTNEVLEQFTTLLSGLAVISLNFWEKGTTK